MTCNARPVRFTGIARGGVPCLGLALLLAGCATTGAGPDAGTARPAAEQQQPGPAATVAIVADAKGGNSAAPAGAADLAAGKVTEAPKPKPDPSGLHPFEEVIKDAKEIKGYFTLWQKDEKAWIEVRPDQLDQPFFLGIAFASGLGQGHFLPGMLPDAEEVSLHRVGNLVQLLARNTLVRTAPGADQARAVSESYSDSLLANAPVVSAPHPDRKTILIDAAALFGGDIPALQTALEAQFHLAYSLDARNTTVLRLQAEENSSNVTMRAHYALGRLPVAALVPGTPGPNNPTPPQALPDPRSLFIDLTYVLSPLPASPMHARAADPRVGTFNTEYREVGRNTGDEPRTYLINRWRLEKKDPAAAISDPREPIVVWLDRNIPQRYRETVRSGILAWDDAFVHAGFSHVFDIRQQPEDADFSTLEGTRHVAVRWFSLLGAGAMAVGPSRADPRSGEMLAGSVIIPENWARLESAYFNEVLPPVAGSPSGAAQQRCELPDDALAEEAFAAALLQSRGELNGPGTEAFVKEGIKAVVMHEMGHVLGLRHNFIASATVPAAALKDAAYVADHGLSNSVMDYTPVNIPLAGEPLISAHQTVLGAYDRWAIEYIYREFPAEEEAAGLAAIVQRAATDPALAYATDEDADAGPGGGIDPRVNRYDLGDDPIAFYARRFALSRELWLRTVKSQGPAAGEHADYTLYRRNLVRGLQQIARILPLATKYIGGVYVQRDLDGRGATLQPVPAERQREALAMLARDLFAADSLRIDPALMLHAAPDFLARGSDPHAGAVDFSLATAILDLQRPVLDALMSDAVAMRLADAEAKVDDPKDLLSFAEVQQTLSDTVWSELKTGGRIDAQRRSLQREHLRRVAAAVVRPNSAAAADVRAVERAVAVRLVDSLRKAIPRSKDPATAAHLAESLATMEDALVATMVRPGV